MEEQPGASLALQEYQALVAMLALQERKQAARPNAARFLDDPLGFVDHCVRFPKPKPGSRSRRVPGLTGYQREILAAIPKRKRVAVRGPRGLGKTALASLAVLWFAVTREMAGVDWKVVTTAGSWAQLTDFTWVEIRKWANLVDWDAVGRGPLNERSELMKTGMTLRHGIATASSPDQAAKIEGAHADSLLFLFDESKIISAETFDAAEGAFSAAGDDSDLEAFALAVSTPGEPSGRFYDFHRRAPGLEDWFPIHVTLDEAVAAGRMSRDWANRRARLWGTGSALFQNHVMGEFCADDEDAVIPLGWVEAAQERWRAWEKAGCPEPEGVHVIGVDVARSGTDKSVAAIRHGNVVTRLVTWAKEDTMETVGRVKGLLTADPEARALVDVIGIGAGVYDRCREQGLNVDPFHAGKKTARKDKTGQFGFVNVRAAAWWSLREQLDPANSPDLALPLDDELAGDLTSMHYKYTSNGLIQVESKDEIRKRIGRSTDLGDGVMESAWPSAGSFFDVYGLVRCPSESCGRGFAAEVNGRPREFCPFCRAPLDGMEGEAA